jgi:hypothetical protein
VRPGLRPRAGRVYRTGGIKLLGAIANCGKATAQDDVTLVVVKAVEAS